MLFQLASNVNFLMTSALRAIAFMPYGALLDLWRWDVFKGKKYLNYRVFELYSFES